MSQSSAPPSPAHPANAERTRKGRRGVEIVTPIPGPNAQKLVDQDNRLMMTSTKSAPIAAASAQGVWVTDVDGNRLLDFASGVGVLAVGHCHPEVVAAVREEISQ